MRALCHRSVCAGALCLAAFAIMAAPSEDDNWTSALAKEADTLGKPSWRPMLKHLAQMHARSSHPAVPPFKFAWEDTGTGYALGPAFGHWDLVHEILDELPTAREHALDELRNDTGLQLETGFLPGLYWMNAGANEGRRPRFDPNSSHPPVWVVAADDYLRTSNDRTFAREFFGRATRQVKWFETARRAQPDGFLYNDILIGKWESGVDEGVRFDDRGQFKTTSCVDASSHVYQLCDLAARWAKSAGEDPRPWTQRADHLRSFIRTQLWDERDGFFFDSWAIQQPALKRQAFEGMWPVVVGAATRDQANRVIDQWLLAPAHFYTRHPIATVGATDPEFEPRMWRGPAWNSMTYWAARGCMRYGRPDAARKLLERALDDTAKQFARTGTIWEFYDSNGGFPENMHRKPQTKRNLPFDEYLGHNPLFAMTRLWQAASPRRAN